MSSRLTAAQDDARIAMARAEGRRPGPPPRQPLMSEADIAKAQKLLAERAARKARG